MKRGTLYGIGIGPGDPELLTLKAVRILGLCPFIYMPTSRYSKEDYVADVARRYARDEAQVREVTFSLAPDMASRRKHWEEPASGIVELLRAGVDVAFLTIGDPLVYSTYIYLLLTVRRLMPDAVVETVPGITSFSQCAALTSFPLGEGKEPITIVPTSEDLEEVRRAIATGGTVVLMKIGGRLQALLDLLDDAGLLSQGVFVARAGLPDQVVETDLSSLRGAPEERGNLAVILIHANRS